MVQFLQGPRHRIAYDLLEARDPALPFVLFCGGYRSDMRGSKATFLAERCRARGQGCLLFDYSGHGQSGGDFMEGSIGEWFDDAKAMLQMIPHDKVIVIGSSMGGWIALKLAMAFPEKVRALIGIAAGPDFTGWIEEAFTPAQKIEMAEKGYVEEPNDYSPEPYRFTRKLIEDGRNQFIMTAPIAFDGPVRLLQGMRDTAVPWQVAHRIKKALTSADCEVFLVEDGDHSLSRPQDLALLDKSLVDLMGRI